ncbi:unnamed protein product, partial [marine sediment metagenome]
LNLGGPIVPGAESLFPNAAIDFEASFLMRWMKVLIMSTTTMIRI